MRHRAFYEDDSEIHDSGCFVTGYWFRGDSIEVNASRRTQWHVYCVETTDGWFYIDYPFSLINHSSEPNAELLQIDDNTFELMLLTDVADGDEITIHYGEDWE